MVEADQDMRQKVLALVPQKPPFLFLDEILELTENTIKSSFTLPDKDHWIYQGHFPHRPVTPGVILIEVMAQTSVVALGIYNVLVARGDLNVLTVFAECEIEFGAMVDPGSQLTIFGQKEYFRHGKLKATARIELADGTLAASGVLSGIGVKE